MKRLAWISIICMGWALTTSCGDDDDDDDDVVTADAAAVIPDAPADTPDAPADTPDAPADTPDAALTRADLFCADVEDVCGFGDTGQYASLEDCKTAFDGYPLQRQNCVEMHLGFAAGDPGTHCPHVAGERPCN